MNDDRPSSIGEILDRAISTYLRRAIPLFVILAVIAVPVALAQSATTPGLTHTIDLFQALNKLPPGAGAERAHATAEILRSAGAPGGQVALLLLVQAVLMALGETAFILLGTAALDGGTLPIAAAYRGALARWIPQLVAGIAFLVLLVAIGIVAVIAGVLLVFAIAGISAVSTVAGIVVGAIVAIAFIGLVFAVTAVANVAWMMTMISVATEEPNPFRAVGNGLRRTLDRSLRRRTIGVALAVLALQLFGSFAILAFGGVLTAITRIDAISAVLSAIGGVVIEGVCLLFVMVYVRDLRLRREGTDLLLATAAPLAPA